LLSKTGYSQTNLVSNPGFEAPLSCPSQINLFQGYARNWWGLNDQIFDDTCSLTSDLAVPYNLWGYQYPRSGICMAGMNTIILDSTFASTKNLREYIYTPLSDTLQAGKNYYVSFWVNCSKNAMYACNDFGAYFSKNYLLLNHHLQAVTPQMQNNTTTNLLTDTAGWQQIKGRFIAAGGEKYLTLGNFTPDSIAHVTYLHGSPNPTYDWKLAFYYIDDVEVMLDSAGSLGIADQQLNRASVSVFPNPNNGNMTVNYSLPNAREASLELFDSYGRLISDRPLDLNKTTAILSESFLPNGIYQVQIITDGTRVSRSKVVILH
jgi:hypothetical protein